MYETWSTNTIKSVDVQIPQHKYLEYHLSLANGLHEFKLWLKLLDLSNDWDYQDANIGSSRILKIDLDLF